MERNALVIDDNATNLDALAALLNREGVTPYSVQFPRDIDAALDEAGTIDIVFLDLEFPNDSGFDLVSDLRTDPRLKGVPIVAYTVHISEQNEALEAGFHSFIGKPLSVERFPEQLSRIFRGERVWEAD